MNEEIKKLKFGVFKMEELQAVFFIEYDAKYYGAWLEDSYPKENVTYRTVSE